MKILYSASEDPDVKFLDAMSMIAFIFYNIPEYQSVIRWLICVVGGSIYFLCDLLFRRINSSRYAPFHMLMLLFIMKMIRSNLNQKK